MDVPIEDGSDKPLGYTTPDGDLEVRDFVDGEGIARRGYCETELGQHMRWMRSASDLFELYQAAINRSDDSCRMTVDVRGMPEVIAGLQASIASMLREEADAEADPRLARKLRECADRVEVGL